MSIDEVLTKFPDATRDRNGWAAKCPAHDDRRASLSIRTEPDGRVLLHCHAHCAYEAILAAVHIQKRDLFPTKPSTENGGAIIATYDYGDEPGGQLFQVVRFAPKDFRQRRPDGQGGWIWNLQGVRRVLYRLRDLQGQQTIFVCEGEEDVKRLWALKLPATTNPGGAGKWRPEYAEMLKQAGCQHVVVLPDNDSAGETHGRDVARSCVDVGLDVKLIPLPDLRAKGDVSDYLDRHSKDELLAIVKDAPLFNPQRLVTASTPIVLTSLADLLGEADDMVDYLVEDRAPAGGVVLIVAPPKGGKSTLARQLSLDVSRGEPFLGWQTTRGTVWLLIFQDKRSEVKKHFRRIGATGAESIRFFIDQAPADILPRLHELAEKERPALIVVDMLAGLLSVKDLNDYAQVTSRFEPLLKLSRASGATLLLLHHCSAHGAREGLDAVLGSTALSGSVDNIFVLKRTDQHRVLSSVQRIGPDLEPTIIVLNPETGRLERAGTKRAFDDVSLGEGILTALRTESEPVSEGWIQEHVEGRNADKVRVLRRLLGIGKVHRLGAGGRKDPYRYTLESSCSRESETTLNKANGREPQSTPANIALFATSAVLVPMFPKEVREQENKNPKNVLPTSVRSSSPTYVPVPEVPEIPATTGNNHRETHDTHVTPHEHESDSCSRDDDFESF